MSSAPAVDADADQIDGVVGVQLTEVIAGIGLTVAGLVVALAVGLGFWQARDGCVDHARDEGREVLEKRWWGKGDYCVTRSADRTTQATNETVWFMFLIVIASIPIGLAAGAGAIVLYGVRRQGTDEA